MHVTAQHLAQHRLRLGGKRVFRGIGFSRSRFGDARLLRSGNGSIGIRRIIRLLRNLCGNRAGFRCFGLWLRYLRRYGLLRFIHFIEECFRLRSHCIVLLLSGGCPLLRRRCMPRLLPDSDRNLRSSGFLRPVRFVEGHDDPALLPVTDHQIVQIEQTVRHDDFLLRFGIGFRGGGNHLSGRRSGKPLLTDPSRSIAPGSRRFAGPPFHRNVLPRKTGRRRQRHLDGRRLRYRNRLHSGYRFRYRHGFRGSSDGRRRIRLGYRSGSNNRHRFRHRFCNGRH